MLARYATQHARRSNNIKVAQHGVTNMDKRSKIYESLFKTLSEMYETLVETLNDLDEDMLGQLFFDIKETEQVHLIGAVAMTVYHSRKKEEKENAE